MKPITLTMVAFGPYNQKEVIDFRTLKENLFLITGPTGAGKTSIFDGISYSIYGRTSGSNRPERSVRCDHASDDLLTQVIFKFELHKKVYQVTRIPEQDRLKKSGQGYTKQKSDAILECESFEKPIVGVKAVNEYLENLIGLSQKQFKQIMMIPQGEFRELLMADSNERSDILKNIFKTYLYEDVQKRFSERKKILKSGLDDQLNHIDLLVHQINTEDEYILNLLEEDHKQVDLILEKIEHQIHDFKDQLKVLKQELMDHKSLYKITLEEKHEKTLFNQKLQSYLDAKEKLEKLLSQTDDHEKRKDKLKILKASESIRPYYDQWLKLKEELKRLKQELLSKEGLLTQSKQVLEELLPSYEKVSSETYNNEIKQLEKSVFELTHQISQVEKANALLGDLNKLKTSLDQLQSENAKEKASYDKQDEALKEKIGFIEAHENCELELEKSQQAKKKLEAEEIMIKAWLDQVAELKNCQNKLSQEKQILNDKREAYDESSKAHKNLQRDYHLNQAALLASELEDHMPCPVCGSKSHPHKAQASGQIITEDMISESESLWLNSQAIYQKAQNAYDKLLETEKDLIIKCDDMSKELITTNILDTEHQVIQSVDEKMDAWRKKHQVIEETVVTFKTNKAFVKDHKAFMASQLKKIQTIENNIRLIGQELASKQGQYDTFIKDIPKEDQSLEELQEEKIKISHTLKSKEEEKKYVLNQYNHEKEKELQLKTQGDGLKDQVNHLTESLQLAYDKLLALLKEKEIDSIETLIDLLSHTVQIHNLEVSIKSYEDQLLLLKDKCLELQEFENKGLHDLSILDEKIKALEEKEGELNQKISDINKWISQHESIIHQVVQIRKDILKSEQDYKVLAHLSDVINGKNVKNINLERFVQATYLEDILEVANSRLLKMTNNRYLLKIGQDVMDRRSGSGLDLEVDDSFTGQARSVKTLSGGESFKASLALALALAEVVQAYAGGIQLDTVFIDEGFGTLDQESLDSAINCLVDLQDSGRLVGIISHVSELKERIQSQLLVKPGDAGSTTEFINI